MTPVTIWIVGDFEKISGKKLLLNALKHVVSTVKTQGIINMLGCIWETTINDVSHAVYSWKA